MFGPSGKEMGPEWRIAVKPLVNLTKQPSVSRLYHVGIASVWRADIAKVNAACA